MQYYLYKQGTLTGPISSEKLEELKKSKRFYDYHWMIDSEQQTWKCISDSPAENPFQLSKNNLKDRSLSAAFMVSKKAFTGEIKNLHSFGVEIILKGLKHSLKGLSDKKSISLNLCDETNLTFVNAKALPQSQEMAEDGLHIIFNWDQHEVLL